MNASEIERLLEAIRVADADKFEIIQQVRNLVQTAAPECQERVMYGGIMFTVDGTDWGGVFASKNHVTVEFSKGHRLVDISGFLAGKGTFRRHIKLGHLDDIAAKQLAGIIAQTLDQL